MPRSNESYPFKARTVLGGGMKFKGVLRFEDSLKINGHFEGTIDSPGFLIVETGAEVIASITVGTLVVGGTIYGNVSASERLEFLPGGHIVGDIRCPNLIMAEATGLQGNCEMLDDPAGVDIFSLPLDRLKKTLSRVG